MASRPVPTINPTVYAVERYATEGVISRRFWAYLIDLVVISFWFLLVCLALVVLGPLTLGLTWVVLAVGLPIAGLTFVIYNAITIGGSAQATVGMRAMGLRVVDPHTGAPVSMLAAAVHALLFYVAVSTCLLWAGDVLIGFARDDRRFARDLLTGMMVIRI